MYARFSHARRPDSLAIILLAALLFHAYIPVGFMPASGTPFLLELCPAYADAGADMSNMSGMASHHQHSPAHSNFQNCPFGSVPAPGPVSHHVAFELPGRTSSSASDLFEAPPPVLRLALAHLPRGPPSPA